MAIYQPGDEDYSRAILDAAISYGRRGHRLFLTDPRTKRPGRKGWQKSATGEPHALLRQFGARPDAGLALLLGVEIRPGDFTFALDVDLRSGGYESLARLESHIGGPMPYTATTWTGGGGIHYLMTAPFRVRNGPLGPDWPGLDIKGHNGYVVAAPTIHPNGRAYREVVRMDDAGEARAPTALLWMIQASPGKGAAPAPRPRPPGPETPPAPEDFRELPAPARRPAADRSGNAATLAASLIASDPVPRVHTRHWLHWIIVGRLIGQGYPDGMVRAAVRTWAEHYHRQGKVATDLPAVFEEIDVQIRWTRENPRFGMAVGIADHRAMCRAVELGADLENAIKTLVKPSKAGGRTGGDCEGPTKPPGGRPPGLARRAAYVEALCVHVLHGIGTGQYGRDGVLKMTDKQVVEVATDRHPEIEWDENETLVGRQKNLFIGRPNDDKTAKVVELLSETLKGRKERGQDAGYPSEYRLTGIWGLLSAAARARIPARAAAPAGYLSSFTHSG